MSFVNKLSFVKKQHETDDIYTFYFSLPKGLKHTAGQHGIFVIPGLYKPHPFTLSSAPEEQYVTISTHVDTGSRYKKKLMAMSVGDKMVLLGPILKFTLRQDAKDYVFLAQGIGITPFRSILFHAHSKQLPIQTTLIHVDSKQHAFRELTEQTATKAYYPATADDFRTYVSGQNTNRLFYISGSPRFVKSTKELLSQQGVQPRNVITDSFLGY